MNATENKRLLHEAFADLSKGNSKRFVECMAEDFRWIITGTTPWSRSYEGKETVMKELIRPLFAQFATQYTNTARRFIAEDDHVVVECRGNVTTKSGKPYNNTYCYVIRMADGKMRELTEYFDTALVWSALDGP